MIVFNRKGSIVVETALIFPIIFLTVVALIYMCLFLYEKFYLQFLADLVAERGATTWGNFKKDISLGYVSKDDLNAGGLYWRLFDLNRDKKEENLRDYLNRKLNPLKVLNPHYISNVEVVDCISYKKLIVTVQADYRLPLGKILQKFGLSNGYYTISARAESVINEPAEFIRNTDFIVDLGKEIEEKFPGYGKKVNQIRKTVKELKEKVINSWIGNGAE